MGEGTSSWPEGEFDGRVGHLIDGCQSFECVLVHEHLLNCIFGVQFSLDLFSPASFSDEFGFFLEIGCMEDLECIDVLGKRGLLIDDSFELFILLFDGIDTFLVLAHQVFGL